MTAATDGARGARPALGRPRFYFDRYESRRPPPPLPVSRGREAAFAILATLALALGARYLWWRWTASLNADALWFAIPVAAAESLAYLGFGLYALSIWRTADPPRQPPPSSIRECVAEGNAPDRPLSVDVFFATYGEDPELVRLSLRDAKQLAYPHPIDLRIHVLDDGGRAAMKQMAEDEGVNYISRTTNIGYKAGNLRNGMELTSGDFLVICDADTRPFPTLLEHTLGYFRDPRVAWVQTPQWFYDIPAGDPFGSDPRFFYDVIQRRRNWANASFCCGAASIHRREAVMLSALTAFARRISSEVDPVSATVNDTQVRLDLASAMRREMVLETELVPFKFHVSEDIYTSISLHEDRERAWKSVLHPWVESKMLSPQDLQTYIVQRFKYAGGTLDIALHDNPVFRGGLTAAQKVMYGATFWGHLAAPWTLVLLLAPAVYLFTGIAPVAAYSRDFFLNIVPFVVTTELAFAIGTWGIPTWAGRLAYMASFPLHLRALWTVLRNKKIAFPVTPKERQRGTYLHLVWPQLIVLALSAGSIVYAVTLYGLGRWPSTGGLAANTLWSLQTIWAMSAMVRASLWRPDEETR